MSASPQDSRLSRISREMLLAGLTPESIPGWALDRATGLLEEEALPSGTLLFSHGDPAEFVSFIREGRFEAVAPDGPAWRLEGNWVVGLFDAVMGRPHARSIRLASDAHVLRVRSEAWLELLEDCFELTYSLLLRAVETTAALEDEWEGQSPLPPVRRLHLHSFGAAPLSLVDKLALLVEVPLLKGSGVQTLTDLAAHARSQRYATGEVLLARGPLRDCHFLVVDGEVVGTRADREVTRRYGAGDVVLGTAAFGRASQAWEVRAAAPTRALSFAVEDWLELMEQDFDIARSAFGWVASERERLLDCLSADGDWTFRREAGNPAGEV